MAAVTVTATMAAGVVYTVRTDTSADFPSVANDKYIYNLADKLVYYKDAEGIVNSIFGANKKFTYEISFNEVTEVLQKFKVDTTITELGLTNIDVLEIDINGGGFNVLTLPADLPLVFSVDDEVTWKITYSSGKTLATINLTAIES
jgi:hypothetical protein